MPKVLDEREADGTEIKRIVLYPNVEVRTPGDISSNPLAPDVVSYELQATISYSCRDVNDGHLTIEKFEHTLHSSSTKLGGADIGTVIENAAGPFVALVAADHLEITGNVLQTE